MTIGATLYSSAVNTKPIAPSTAEMQKLHTITQKSHEILLHASTVFPFDFFPDEVTIDKNKIDIIHRLFFFSGQIHSIPIEDVGDVVVESGPFFATLKLFHRRVPFKEIEVRYLTNKSARRIQEVIQGLVLASENSVETEKINKEDLIKEVSQSGKILHSL